MARHRHAVNVRADGLTAVLGPLGDDPAVRAALLLDIDSGMVLGATGHPTNADREELGAVHGELMRLACASVLDGGDAAALDTEVVVHGGARRHVVVRGIADPYGDRLALSLLVDGPPRAVRRVRRRMRWVSTAALTAGPTVSLRPRDGAWVPGAVEERPVLRAPSRPEPRPVADEPDAADRTPALAGLDDGVRIPRPRLGPFPALGTTTVPSLPAVGPRAGRQEAAPDRRPAPPSALPPPGPGRP